MYRAKFRSIFSFRSWQFTSIFQKLFKSLTDVWFLVKFCQHLNMFPVTAMQTVGGECNKKVCYSVTTWTGPLKTKLANQKKGSMVTFSINGPMKLQNANNGLTKIWNLAKLHRVAELANMFWLVCFNSIFNAECTIGMVWGLTALKHYGNKALRYYANN